MGLTTTSLYGLEVISDKIKTTNPSINPIIKKDKIEKINFLLPIIEKIHIKTDEKIYNSF